MLYKRKFPKVLLLLLFILACQPDLETVETVNSYGHKERYQRRKKDFAKDGLYERFHPDGYKIEEAHYKNDTLDGERRLYYQTGQVERVERYRAGVFHGVFQQFYENGRQQLEQNFVDGRLEGLSTAWYPNGALREKVMLRDNEENGPFTEWYENGKMKAEGNYIDGDNEDGTLKLYDTLGQLERVLECQRGACQTTWARE